MPSEKSMLQQPTRWFHVSTRLLVVPSSHSCHPAWAGTVWVRLTLDSMVVFSSSNGNDFGNEQVMMLKADLHQRCKQRHLCANRQHLQNAPAWKNHPVVEYMQAPFAKVINATACPAPPTRQTSLWEHQPAISPNLPQIRDKSLCHPDSSARIQNSGKTSFHPKSTSESSMISAKSAFPASVERSGSQPHNKVDGKATFHMVWL